MSDQIEHAASGQANAPASTQPASAQPASTQPATFVAEPRPPLAVAPRESVWGLPIIDVHCHFPAPDSFDDALRDRYIAEHGAAKYAKLRANWRWYQDEWWRNYGFPPPEEVEAAPPVQRDRWRAEIEAAQLEAVVFVSGGGNRLLAKMVQGDARMIGFAHHDPFGEGAAAELERAVVEDGMRGYKIVAPTLTGAIDDPALHPVWRVAERTGIPVLVHFGQNDGGGGIAYHQNINPLILHDVAKAYPDVDFVVPHFGCGYPRELLHLAWACRNVSVDSSGNNEWVRWMPETLTVPMLFRRFYETVGPTRILFGSDSCSFPRGLARRYTDDQVRAVREMGIPEHDMRLIFGGNAARMLGIERA